MKKSAIIFVYLFLGIATAALFWEVQNFDFINYDDDIYVSQNAHVLGGLNPANILWAFTTGQTDNWHPVTWLSLMLDSLIFGTDPGWFHLVNLFIHIANTLLLFTVLRKMTAALWPSAFVAALFALHPMHVQSVAWISERKDVLSTFFFMLTLLAYVSFVKKPNPSKYILALLLFALGLMAKPMLVTLPFVLLLLDFWPLNRFVLTKDKAGVRNSHDPPAASLKKIIAEKIPFLVLAVFSSIITYLVQQRGGAVVAGNALDLAGRISNASVSYLKYLSKLFWPQNLAVFYPFNLAGSPFWETSLCIFLLLAISVLVVRFAKKNKYLPVGWFWFLGTLIPVIGLVQIGEQAYADRYTYIPYIGLFIIISWGLSQFLSKWHYKKIALSASIFVIISVLMICSYRQIGYWKNSFTLFSHAIEVTQNNYLAYSSLGDEFRKKADLERALEHCKKAVQIAPNYPNAVLGLGSVLADKGDLDNAIAYFEKIFTLKTDPVWQAAAHTNIAIALRSKGKLDESAAHFEQSILLNPDSAQARNSFAKTLILKRNFDDARQQLEEAIRINSNWAEPLNSLALLISIHPEMENRDMNRAVQLAKRACELTNYSNPVALGTLAAAYGAQGRFPEAIDESNKAISIADMLNQPQVKGVLQAHLACYIKGKPYIETVQKH